MQIVIAGAGSVGRSIARELLSKGHEVTLIDRLPDQMRVASVAQADWVLADACSPESLKEAGVATCDVIVAATGDDKANLVISLLSKTEFGVPRVVARVNNPKNEWMFDEAWGVDVRVSTPRVMTALVEEAVSVSTLVPLFEFHEAGAALYSYTVGADSSALDTPISALALPGDAKILSVLRDDAPLDSLQDVAIDAGDQLILMLASKEASLCADLELILGPKRVD